MALSRVNGCCAHDMLPAFYRQYFNGACVLSETSAVRRKRQLVIVRAIDGRFLGHPFFSPSTNFKERLWQRLSPASKHMQSGNLITSASGPAAVDPHPASFDCADPHSHPRGTHCHPPAPIRMPATHPVRGPPAQIRVPPIQPGAFPFARRESQTLLFGA